MNQKENGELKIIAQHVTILNEEVGILKNDIRWIKKIGYYMATVITAIFISILGITIKLIY